MEFTKKQDPHMGEFSRQNLLAIYQWKTNGRGVSRIARNSDEEISLHLALSAKTERAAISVCLANCYEGRYYRQIAPRRGDASPFLNGPGDSETIGAAKRTATNSAYTA